jgi:hypothetical protein
MRARFLVGLLALAVVVGSAGPAAGQGASRSALARELAQLMIDDTVRRVVDEQVRARLAQSIASTLQERLNRRLVDVEWRLLARIVGRFVAETLPPSRKEEIAAEVYAGQFDEAELEELVRFQRSALGRKVARLTPVIATETAQALDLEIRRSPAIPRMVDELQRAFPVLRAPESP